MCDVCGVRVSLKQKSVRGRRNRQVSELERTESSVSSEYPVESNQRVILFLLLYYIL